MFTVLESLHEKCTQLVDQFFEHYLALFGEYKYAGTPYIHLLAHLPELQRKLGTVIGFFQNGSMYFFLFFFVSLIV